MMVKSGKGPTYVLGNSCQMWGRLATFFAKRVEIRILPA